MLVDIYCILLIAALIIWFMAFYTKQEILWGIAAILFAVLMMSSYGIEMLVPTYNASFNGYQYNIITESYNYLAAINMIFFGLVWVLGLFDIFDKYGKKMNSV